MTRSEFVKLCGILGVGLPFHLSLMSCSKDEEITANFKEKVIIIGAGAGGLSAGYLLQQQGIDFEILEASSSLGGRMKIDTDFTDFPIPLGAEWLETDTAIFKEIVNNPSVSVDVETVEDDPDRKFVNYSWFSFFEEYIVPSIAGKISYNTPVSSIDYSDDKIIVASKNGTHTADKVIVSVPLKILQDQDIKFIPSLPKAKLDAIKDSNIWEGFKAFFKFSTKFYQEEYEFPVTPKDAGEKIFYNATKGQNTSENILGLFAVGKPVLDYLSLSDDALKDHILSELDGIYNNQATPNYLSHIYQNWNKEPYIKAGYLSDHADWKTVRELGKSVADKIYFAGGAYTTGEDWVSVHTAAQSARVAVVEIGN